MSGKYYLGWDVGAWSCTSKSKSCDAIVVLDENGVLVGKPYRNSIKTIVNEAKNVDELLTHFFSFCNIAYHGEEIVLAIDTPLGYSEAFVKLITSYVAFEPIQDEYKSNRYLFRKTEQHIFETGITRSNGKVVKPLSAVNDRIGAQSTKGIHFISKFAPIISEVGVWKSACEKLTIIETYPAINDRIEIPDVLAEQNGDIQDAFICAHIAYLFGNNKKLLIPPLSETPEKEGWIWYLTLDVLKKTNYQDTKQGMKQELLTGKTRLV